MEKLNTSPTPSHRKEKEAKGQSQESTASVVYEGSTVCSELTDHREMAQTRPITPSQHQPAGRTSLPLRGPYSLSLQTTVLQPHTQVKAGGKWTRDRGLTGSLETSPSHNQSTVLGSGYTVLPGKPSPLPSTGCPTRLAVQTKEMRKSWLVVNSHLRRQMAIHIYDGKFHYLKMLL